MTTKHTPGPWVLDADGHDIRTHGDHWSACLHYAPDAIQRGEHLPKGKP